MLSVYRIIVIATCLILAINLSACSPGYVIRAAYEQTKILVRREKIEHVLQKETVSAEEKSKLSLVLKARNFAESLGLKPGDSYLSYSRLDRDVLSWIVMASRRDAFDLYTWWFPFVGRVPYKGYFDRPDAEDLAESLDKNGYETWVRPTEAFSTLGWFNDPVLTPMLKRDEVSIVNTIIHESFHSTFWLPGHVDFNESLANFVGMEGAIRFFNEEASKCQGSDKICVEQATALFEHSKESKIREFEIAELIDKLYRELDQVYNGSSTPEEKLANRKVIFHRFIDPLKQRYPKLKAFQAINNAEIMQYRIYLKKLPAFEALFNTCNKDFSCFVSKLDQIKKALKSEEDPFMLL